MTEESAKTYVFDSAKGSMDPATLLALMNGNGGFGGNGNWMWIIFLFFLYGWGGNGMFGGRGFGSLGNQVNQDYGTSLLLQAINGNGTAISQLASTLNCDVNSIRTAIDSVSSSICQLGNSVNMNSAQIISAINSGNQTLSSQLAQCCCDNKLLVTQQGYENRIAIGEQTNFLGAKIDYQTNFLADKFCDLEKRELQNKIDALREERSTLLGRISNAEQTAQIQSYVASVVNPIAADVAAIKCSTPPTIPVQFPSVTAVQTTPYCGGFGYGYGPYGPWGNGGAWA